MTNSFQSSKRRKYSIYDCLNCASCVIHGKSGGTCLLVLIRRLNQNTGHPYLPFFLLIWKKCCRLRSCAAGICVNRAAVFRISVAPCRVSRIIVNPALAVPSSQITDAALYSSAGRGKQSAGNVASDAPSLSPAAPQWLRAASSATVLRTVPLRSEQASMST